MRLFKAIQVIARLAAAWSAGGCVTVGLYAAVCGVAFGAVEGDFRLVAVHGLHGALAGAVAGAVVGVSVAIDRIATECYLARHPSTKACGRAEWAGTAGGPSGQAELPRPTPVQPRVVAETLSHCLFTYQPVGANSLLLRNLLIWSLGGVVAPFLSVKRIDMMLVALNLVR